MSPHRRPAAFRLDDPHVVLAEPDEPRTRAPRGTVLVTPEPDAALLPVPIQAPGRPRRRLPWATMFWSALGGLTTLGLGLAVTRLIEDLLARAPALGYVALALAVLAGVALAAVVGREVAGLIRLNAVERLRERAESAIASDDRAEAAAVVRDLIAVERVEPRRARAPNAAHLGDIIDGADLVRLAERELMEPLDAEARRLVAAPPSGCRW